MIVSFTKISNTSKFHNAGNYHVHCVYVTFDICKENKKVTIKIGNKEIQQDI